MKYLIIPILIIPIIFTACSTKFTSKTIDKEFTNKRITKLYTLLVDNFKHIDKKEAKDLSKNAIYYSMFLANQYEVTTSPLIHNTLINLNIKKRGYCYHYANDLRRYLNKQRYKSFKLIKIISSRNKYFEHSSIAIIDKYTEFKNAIVLDAWRDAGVLYFSRIKDDKRYKWEKK